MPKWKKYLSLPMALGRATSKVPVKQEKAAKSVRMQPPSTS